MQLSNATTSLPKKKKKHVHWFRITHMEVLCLQGEREGEGGVQGSRGGVVGDRGHGHRKPWRPRRRGGGEEAHWGFVDIPS